MGGEEEEEVSEEVLFTYYYNTATRESQWDRPLFRSAAAHVQLRQVPWPRRRPGQLAARPQEEEEDRVLPQRRDEALHLGAPAVLQQVGRRGGAARPSSARL